MKVKVTKVIEQVAVNDANGKFKDWKETVTHNIDNDHIITEIEELNKYYCNFYECRSCLVHHNVIEK